MAFFDSSLRRESAPITADAPRKRATAPVSGKATKAGGSSFYHWNFIIHKWTGLFAAAWLAVLGLTGFFLDHDSWRWQFQAKVPGWLTTQALQQNATRNVVRLLQIDPDDHAARLAGGQRGLWVSHDSGESWLPTVFAGGGHPQALAIEPDPALGWERLWLATDDGVYVSRDHGANAERATLAGAYVTSLAAGATGQEMLAVIDKSEVVRFATDNPGQTTPLALTAPEAVARPQAVAVNRFVRELHFGKGVFDPLSSLIMNDIGGIGMFVLSLTGLLYWGLPKYWKHQAHRAPKGAAAASKTSKGAKKATIQWLFRIHSATLGIASVLMLVYLSVTGIFIGHGRELGDWMRATQIPQNWLTPVFGLPSWKGWIDAVVAYPDQPEAITIGSRIGLFTSVDGGASWAREDGADGKPLASAGRLRRLGDKVAIPNGMAGPSIIRGADLAMREVTPAPDAAMGRRRGGGRGANAANGMANGMGGGMSGGMDHSRHGGGMRGEGGERSPERIDAMASMNKDGADAAGASAGMGAMSMGAMSMAMGMGDMSGMFMPSDVTRLGDKFAWKTSDKLIVTDADGREVERIDVKQPEDPGVPWFNWFLRVHMGTIFWSEWRWVNDVFAISCVFLSVTGLVRWWRKKWA